jgi:hypothetical protein
VDWDHYIRGSFWGYGTDEYWVEDGLVYDWSTNPATGAWHPYWNPPIYPTAYWRAPPCIGTVQVSLDVDDVPDEAMNPCPGYSTSDRDDSGPVTFTDSIQVVLPTGCETGTKGVDLSVYEVDPSSSHCSTLAGCGYTDYGVDDEIDITAVYDSCRWVFRVGATKAVESGPCTSKFIDISGGDDPDLPTDPIAVCMIITDFLTFSGCCLDGSSRYSNASCVEIHEDEHLEMLQEKLIEQNLVVMAKDSMDDVLINCADSCTHNCSDVRADRRDAIETDVWNAYYDARNAMFAEGETRPIEAASQCFEIIALSICAGGSQCGACPP